MQAADVEIRQLLQPFKLDKKYRKYRKDKNSKYINGKIEICKRLLIEGGHYTKEIAHQISELRLKYSSYERYE